MWCHLIILILAVLCSVTITLVHEIGYAYMCHCCIINYIFLDLFKNNCFAKYIARIELKYIF